MLDRIQRALASQTMQFHEYNLQVGKNRNPYEARFVPFGTEKVLAIVRT